MWSCPEQSGQRRREATPIRRGGCEWSHKAIEPLGEARSDRKIICDIARSLGLQFNYPHASSVLDEINRTVPQYAGILRERLDNSSLVWPCPAADHPGTPILHSSGFSLAEGRASIVPVPFIPAAEAASCDHPFILTTGRVAVHHNAGSMTRRSPSLISREPDLYVEMNRVDAEALDMEDGDEVRVATVRGETAAYARLTDRMKKGVVFMPFHFPGTNILTTDATDPEARIPELKVCACNVFRRD